MAANAARARKKGQIKIAAHVVIQLGQELVTDVEQAFLELAKNAYDADSEECVITIDPSWIVDTKDPTYELLDDAIIASAPIGATSTQRRVGRVLITDTGVGANDQGVTDGWLTISASIKRSKAGPKKETAKGRTPVGDKGLGRLATMKIGDLLLFRTSEPDEPSQRITAFSWGQFPRVRTVDQVTVDQWTQARNRPYAQGSVVEIVGLHDRERWQREESIYRLIARLSQLVNPYVGFKDFDIQIQHGKKLHGLQKIGSEVLNFAAAKFEFKWTGKKLEKSAFIARSLFRGSIGEESKAKYDMAFAPENAVVLKTKFRESRRLSNRGVNVDNPKKGWLAEYSEVDDLEALGGTTERPGVAQCGPFEGKIYYFMFNEEFKNKLQGNAASAEQVQEMSGVLVFRDGFRVRIGDDWLRLSEGTTSGNFFNLRPKNTLGYFAVTNRGNPNLVEKSDREGFVDNLALQQFMFVADACRKYANDILHGVREDFNELYNSLLLQTDGVATPRQARAKVKETRKQASSEMLRVRDVAAKAMLRVERAKASLQGATQGSQGAAAASEMETVLASFSELGAGLAEVQTRVAQMDRATDAVESFRKGEADRSLRLLESAAVGLTARVLSHELLSYVDTLDEGVKEIAAQNRKLGNAAISDAIASLTSTLRELRKTVGSLDPLLPGSPSIKESMALGEVITKYVEVRREMIDGKGVQLRVTGEDVLARFKFSRTRFYQILENLLQNSLYWLEKHSKQSPSSRLLIRIAIREDGFDWWDSGPGIVDRYEDTLFDAFVSSKPRGEGQGLGLYIVSTYLESEQCAITLLPQKNAAGRRYKFRVDLSGALVQEK